MTRRERRSGSPEADFDALVEGVLAYEDLARALGRPEHGPIENPAPWIAEAMERVAEDEARAARFSLEKLDGHPVARQVLVIRGRPWACTVPMVQRLCAESDQRRGSDLPKATELARLAMAIADGLAGDEPRGVVNDARARARVRLANALRLRSDYRACEALLAEALEILEEGSGDPLELAEAKRILALLRKTQGRLPEALRLNRAAVKSFEKYGGEHRTVVKMLIARSAIFHEAGRPMDMVEPLWLALDLLEEGDEEESRLFLMIQHNLALSAVERSRLGQARGILSEARWLYERVAGPALRARGLWLIGKVELATGRDDVADELLRRARDEFVEHGIPTEAAQVSLELALVYAEAGRNAEVRRLAAEAAPIFASRGLDRETWAALVMFRRAAWQFAPPAALIRRALERLLLGRQAHGLPAQRTSRPRRQPQLRSW